MAQVSPGTQDIRQAAIYLRDPVRGESLVAQSASPGDHPVEWKTDLDDEAAYGPHALAVAIQTAERTERLGTLMVLLNPQRPLDRAYREFIALVGQQIARHLGRSGS